MIVTRRESLFRDAFNRLSVEHRCNAHEFARIHASWLAAGRPVDVERYIVKHSTVTTASKFTSQLVVPKGSRGA